MPGRRLHRLAKRDRALHPTEGVAILDYWVLRAGDTVNITNRYDDLPEWFQITPGETRGPAARAMLPLVQVGDAPDVPMDAPNIWRVLAGDKVVWVGASRSQIPSHNGILRIFDFLEYALVTGQPADGTLEDWMFFGSPPGEEPDEAALESIRLGVHFVSRLRLGTLRMDGWAIG